MNAEERRFAVLRAIVADYVRTQEPVGSKMIVDRHNLGVSSATVRNDMAVLEDEGLIAQPHTSAGRIPTDKGYRFFVDDLRSEPGAHTTPRCHRHRVARVGARVGTDWPANVTHGVARSAAPNVTFAGQNSRGSSAP